METRDFPPSDSVQSGSLKAWYLAVRPATLFVGAMPVAVGSAIAFALHSFCLGPSLAALFGALFIQIGTNLANDVFDFEKGADTKERLGPIRVTQAGLLSPSRVRLGMYVCFGMATLFGLYLTYHAGPWVVVIGVLSILSGIAYTGGPYPLGYHGLGDLFVFVFFGFVAVVGTAFVQNCGLSSLAVAASIPVGAIATAVLVVNNLRDESTDVTAGKRTLVVRFGRTFGIAEYFLLLSLAYLTPVFLFVSQRYAWPILFPLLSFPLSLPLLRSVFVSKGAELNPVLGKTARLLFVFGSLFVLGICIGS